MERGFIHFEECDGPTALQWVASFGGYGFDGEPYSVDPELRDFLTRLGLALPDDERQKLWPYLRRFLETHPGDGKKAPVDTEAVERRGQAMKRWAYEVSGRRRGDPVDAIALVDAERKVASNWEDPVWPWLWPKIAELLDELVPAPALHFVDGRIVTPAQPRRS